MQTPRIVLDRNSTKPLYAQLRDALLTAIHKKAFKLGDRLPTVAGYAKQLKITPSTVLRAFEDLAADGHVVSYVGRGTFVADASAAKPAPATAQPAMTRSPLEPADPEFALAARRLRMGVAKSLDALNVLAQRPGLISFISGMPDPAIVQPDLLADLTREALKTDQAEYLGYGNPMGLPALRAAIAGRYAKRGIAVSAEQVLITVGSQQAASLLAQAALEQKQRVLCECPCYGGIPNAFGALGHWVESIPRDAQGPMVERFSRLRDGQPTLFYLCPEMHNPMGTDLSPDRRAALLDWARGREVTFIADEIFHDLRTGPSGPPSLFSDAGAERTVVISSLSKSFMCGLRVGWLVSSVERVRSLVALKRAMDISCPPLMQGIALALLSSGAYDAHLVKAREHYRVRRDAALKALKRHMPAGVHWTTPVGGFHMWVELPAGYSSIALYMLAIERGVVIGPGPMMDIDHRFVGAFRLGYGSVDVSRIQEGVELLASAVVKLLEQPPSEPSMSGLGNML